MAGPKYSLYLSRLERSMTVPGAGPSANAVIGKADAAMATAPNANHVARIAFIGEPPRSFESMIYASRADRCAVRMHCPHGQIGIMPESHLASSRLGAGS